MDFSINDLFIKLSKFHKNIGGVLKMTSFKYQPESRPMSELGRPMILKKIDNRSQKVLDITCEPP